MIGAVGEGAGLADVDVRDLCAREMGRWNVRGKRVLMIVPDNTRTAPIDRMFRILHDLLAPDVHTLDVMIALGTHPPMNEEAINRRLGITWQDRAGRYAKTRFLNHDWRDPGGLASIGTISEDEVERLSGGALRERVDVTINKLALTYDLLLIVGPTFPHEVVGFSGGNKYLVPGISGKPIIDMFHWLGALITNPSIIGKKYTPVRLVVDQAAAMVPVERKCVSLVVDGDKLVGLYAGEPEEAWSAAADLSRDVHVCLTERRYESVLSAAPEMYDELWVGGKCVYKLEQVVADGGELIVYAPHISRLSVTHGEIIRQIGYHVRDYFVKQRPRFADVPRGVMAHSTHVKGVGTYHQGIEEPRIRVTLATGISEAECLAVNLAYRDFRTIDVGEWKEGAGEGRLYVARAGETLFLPKQPAPAAVDVSPRAMAPSDHEREV
jgi:nickel-dependent lactate racemase